MSGILKEVIDRCVPGASVRELCEFGDGRLLVETSKVFKKDREIRKGCNCFTAISCGMSDQE